MVCRGPRSVLTVTVGVYHAAWFWCTKKCDNAPSKSFVLCLCEFIQN